VYLIKTDANGNEQWHRTFGGPDEEECYDVYQTPDGGYIFGGRTGGAGNKDLLVIKTNANGDSVWGKTYGGSEQDEGFVFIETSDGGYLIAGETQSYGVGDKDVWMVKINANGDTLWTAIHDFGGDDVAYGAEQTSDGGFALVGYINGGINVMFLLKTDGSGNEQWHRTYNAGAISMLKSVHQTSDGGYIMSGYVYFMSAQMMDVHVVKADANGDTVWTRTYGGEGYDQIWNSIEIANGNFLCVGMTQNFGADSIDFLMMEITTSGSLLWTDVIGTVHNEYATNITAIPSGGYIATGSKISATGDQNAWLLRLGPDMKVIETETVQPLGYHLYPAYPNPFDPMTTLTFDVSRAGNVSLVVYNVLGQEVIQLVDGFITAGTHELTFDAIGLSSGIYFAQLKAGDFHQVGKLVLLK
jgi:hypothetical protein